MLLISKRTIYIEFRTPSTMIRIHVHHLAYRIYFLGFKHTQPDTNFTCAITATIYVLSYLLFVCSQKYQLHLFCLACHLYIITHIINCLCTFTYIHTLTWFCIPVNYFRLRDTLFWLFGSIFPWQNWGFNAWL